MKDKYRKLLSTYRLRSENAKQAAASRRLAPEQAAVLKSFVHRLNNDGNNTPKPTLERRESVRHPCEHFVLVTPCTSPERPRMQDTAPVVVKDISSGGISFVQTGAFTDPYFLVTFQVRGVPPICMLSKVMRMEPARMGLYLVGGEFQERVSLGDEYDRNGQPGEGSAGA